MKHLLVVLSLLCLAVPAVAGLPSKSELAVVGEYIQLDGPGENAWSVNADLLFPLGAGNVLIGPAVALGNVDELNRFGGAVEWNLSPKSHATFFVGAAAYYFLHDVDEAEAVPVPMLEDGKCHHCGVTPPTPTLQQVGSVPLATDDTEDYSIAGKAGFKFTINKGAALKVYVNDTLAGRLKDSTDLGGAIGIIARF